MKTKTDKQYAEHREQIKSSILANPKRSVRCVADETGAGMATVRSANREVGGLLFTKGEYTDFRIMSAFHEDPKATIAAISKKSGSSIDHCCSRLIALGLRAQVSSKLSPENLKWVSGEAKENNVSISEMCNSIITDARLEAGE